MISTNLTSPRFSQLPFWPAGFLTSLLVIENITDLFFSNMDPSGAVCTWGEGVKCLHQPTKKASAATFLIYTVYCT